MYTIVFTDKHLKSFLLNLNLLSKYLAKVKWRIKAILKHLELHVLIVLVGKGLKLKVSH